MVYERSDSKKKLHNFEVNFISPGILSQCQLQTSIVGVGGVLLGLFLQIRDGAAPALDPPLYNCMCIYLRS